MIKKTLTYTDFNGVERTEDFYFNLTKAELTEMELSQEGGLEALIHRIINAKDQRVIVSTFKNLVLKAYGEKSEDGRRFMKSPEITANFVATAAYSEIFMELATDENAASEFVNGVIPSIDASEINAKAVNADANAKNS